MEIVVYGMIWLSYWNNYFVLIMGRVIMLEEFKGVWNKWIGEIVWKNVVGGFFRVIYFFFFGLVLKFVDFSGWGIKMLLIFWFYYLGRGFDFIVNIWDLFLKFVVWEMNFIAIC